MRLGQSGDFDWSDDDLKEMLAHQLSCPLTSELVGLDGIDTEQITTIAQGCQPPIDTFRDLLTAQTPPTQLLEAVKRYAKAVAHLPDRTLPEPIARVLYLACIVVAQLRRDRNMTRHSDEKVRQGVVWALDQPWMDPDLAGVLREFLQAQDSPSETDR